MSESAQTRPLVNACLTETLCWDASVADLLGHERAGQPLLLGRVQPLRACRAVLEVEPGDDPDHDRGDRDAEEHEAPSLEAEEHAVLLDEQAREGAPMMPW